MDNVLKYKTLVKKNGVLLSDPKENWSQNYSSLKGGTPKQNKDDSVSYLGDESVRNFGLDGDFWDLSVIHKCPVVIGDHDYLFAFGGECFYIFDNNKVIKTFWLTALDRTRTHQLVDGFQGDFGIIALKRWEVSTPIGVASILYKGNRYDVLFGQIPLDLETGLPKKISRKIQNWIRQKDSKTGEKLRPTKLLYKF